MAEFDALSGIAVANDGTIYVADSGSNMIRAITADDRVITVAGADEEGFPIAADGEDDGNRLESPQKLLLHEGVLYVADSGGIGSPPLTRPPARSRMWWARPMCAATSATAALRKMRSWRDRMDSPSTRRVG